MAVKVRQHKGAWWVFIDHKGKRKAKKIGTSKRAAEVVAEKIQAKISLGQFEITEEKPQLPTFAEYAERWLETYAKVHLKPATWWKYANDLRVHLNPALGNEAAQRDHQTRHPRLDCRKARGRSRMEHRQKHHLPPTGDAQLCG